MNFLKVSGFDYSLMPSLKKSVMASTIKCRLPIRLYFTKVAEVVQIKSSAWFEFNHLFRSSEASIGNCSLLILRSLTEVWS